MLRTAAAVAALLTREPDAALLSDQEVAESTSRWMSYYRHDLVVADWDAALIIDRPDEFDETLYIMELANVQLEELEAYEVEILDGETVKRVLSTATTSVVYSAAQQTADWGTPLAPGDSLDIRIYQLSALVGRGAPKTVTLIL